MLSSGALRGSALAGAVLLILCPLVSGSQLSAAEVLRSSAAHFPAILRSLAELDATRAEVLSAKGAFDTVFSTDSSSRSTGFFDGRQAGAKVERPFQNLGGSAYLGYRLSGGHFPIYEDELFTSDAGQIKVGAIFSLLRDRSIDQRRFEIADANFATERAELDVMLVRLGVQRRALEAYWRWVAAGRKLLVYNELLQLALERDAALQRQVEDGRRAEIFLTENGQNITRRRTLALTANRDVQLTALDLSFYLRDGDGTPRTPAPDEIPALPLQQDPVDESVPPTDLSSLLERRPELRQLQVAAQRAQTRVALARNQLLPSLGLAVEYASGIGQAGPGGSSKNSDDLVVGLKFSVPLQRRAAAGRLQKAEAERRAVELERQQQAERLELDLQSILLDLEVARELATLARLEYDQADTMREAELRRFEAGASDFFLVNIREERAADARIRWYAAKREARIARANYDAATVNLARLQVDVD